MQPADFSDEARAHLIRAPQGYWAFVPPPLPPAIDLTWSLVQCVSDADRALGTLGGIAHNLPNPHLLIGPFSRREAVLSSRIEGTQASLSDLFFFEAATPKLIAEPGAADVREVANYVRALEHGLTRLEELPLSLRLIREVHEVLMRGVRGDSMTPGEFRRSQNWIGGAGSTLADATYVPPPVPEMNVALAALETFLHAPSPLPPLVRLALVHYQLEAIHPFLDGNGRVGRLLVSLLLCHEKLLAEPLLYLSAYFERQRAEYYRLLLAVSQQGRYTEWIEFFLLGVAEQSRDASLRTERLLSLWRSYRARFEAARSSALLLRLVDHLFENPVLTIGAAAKLLDITHRAATLNVEKVVAAGILTEVPGRERNRVFVARELIALIEASRVD